MAVSDERPQRRSSGKPSFYDLGALLEDLFLRPLYVTSISLNLRIAPIIWSFLVRFHEQCLMIWSDPGMGWLVSGLPITAILGSLLAALARGED
jgi:hypothetical protein